MRLKQQFGREKRPTKMRIMAVTSPLLAAGIWTVLSSGRQAGRQRADWCCQSRQTGGCVPADSRQDDLRVRGRPVAAAVWPLSAPLSDCSPQLNEGTVANQPVRLGAKTKHRWSLSLNGLQSNTMKTLLMAKGQPTYLTKNFEITSGL